MKRKDIIIVLKKLIESILEGEEININENTVITGNVGDDIVNISSIDFVTLIIKVEEIYKIAIDFDVPIKTISDLIDIIVYNLQHDEFSLEGNI